MISHCWSCQGDISLSVGFRDECPNCRRDTHVCLNCRFYDPGAFRQCRETVPEPVVEKEKRNFCEYFKPKNTSNEVSKAPKGPSPLELAEALFKKKN